MSFVDSLKTILDSYKNSEVFTIELARFEKLLAEAEAEIAALRHENECLVKENAEMKKQIREKAAEPETFSYRGAAFRREGAGGEINGPYCPECIPGGFTAAPGNRLLCLRCHSVPAFNASEVAAVLAKVRSTYG